MINSISKRDFEAQLDLNFGCINILSLRTYNLELAYVTADDGVTFRVVSAEPVSNSVAHFTDINDAAVFVQAKYSDGVKPHKHVWDLAIGGALWPAYTVGCLLPGCNSELVVPPWIKEDTHGEHQGDVQDSPRNEPNRNVFRPHRSNQPGYIKIDEGGTDNAAKAARDPAEEAGDPGSGVIGPEQS